MVRREEWPRLLAAFIAAREELPFAWYDNDCCTFAAAWLAECLWNCEPLAQLDIARYRGPTGARNVLRRYRNLEGVATAVLGAPLLDVKYAQRGDVVQVLLERRRSLAVCDGDFAVGPGLRGLVHVPMTAAQIAWRV